MTGYRLPNLSGALATPELAIRAEASMCDKRESSASPRRAFLRGLLTLPLIGGGLKLLGNPVAAASPVSIALLERYHAFLCRETAKVLAELDQIERPYEHFGPDKRFNWNMADVESLQHKVPFYLLRADAEAARVVAESLPSTRAAVVLAAVGVPLPRVGA